MNIEQITHHLRIAYLLSKRFLNFIEPAEQAELDAWIRQDPVRHQRIADGTLHLQIGGRDSESQLDAAWQEMRKRTQGRDRSVKNLWTGIWPRVAAAAIVVLAGAGLYLAIDRSDFSPEDTFDPQGLTRETTLLSPDGIRIVLSADQRGVKQTGDQLVYLDGEAVEGLAAGASNPVTDRSSVRMFTLHTPIQSYYQMELSDGSYVWLNAQSKLSYPETFDEQIRRVYLEGEAYFEIAHSTVPFIVETRDVEINVHGTNFNARAYNDDSLVKTALRKGSVSVIDKNNKTETLLKPGQLATYDHRDARMTVREENIDEHLSWLGGKLYFRHAELETVLYRLSQWYGFSFEFDDPAIKKYKLTGVAYMDHELDYTLKLVAESTGVQFRWIENQLHILN